MKIGAKHNIPDDRDSKSAKNRVAASCAGKRFALENAKLALLIPAVKNSPHATAHFEGIIAGLTAELENAEVQNHRPMSTVRKFVDPENREVAETNPDRAKCREKLDTALEMLREPAVKNNAAHLRRWTQIVRGIRKELADF